MKKSRVKDISGERVGHLVAVKHVGMTPSGNAVWEAVCDCGKTVQRDTSAWGKSRTAGSALCGNRCPFFKPGKTHGLSQTPEYRTWRRMLQRCYTPRNPSFKRYGGRGIKVCQRWQKDFTQFYKDMGPAPKPGLSLDRINPNGNYGPSNCRWATPKEQGNNRTNNRMLDTPWGRLTATMAAEKSGIPYQVLMGRLQTNSKGDLFRSVRPRDKPMDTQWGPMTIVEACAMAGISPKLVWSRMSRGITDPAILFSTKDLRIEKP